ncbi:MAG TPA: ACP S-malonyltransferase [Myxococcaceae bacterium]|nr:ACP S-malonyltransferase [Myxococcaceae bacterium]
MSPGAAFLFPGQGSESPGMGAALLRRSARTRALLARASRALDLDLEAAVARGHPLLRRTEALQPVLLAIGLGLAEELERSGTTASAVAGHSVGEMAAVCAAGYLAAEEAMDAVVERGRLMAEAARLHPGGMAALRARAQGEVSAALEVGLAAGPVGVAAHNGPTQWVLSGSARALAAVASRFPTVPLPVSGPWHSELMADAERRWLPFLRQLQWRPPRLALVAGQTGQVVEDGDDLPALLAAQLTRPVRWAEALRTLADAGVEAWHVLGPGRTLRGLCRENLGLQVQVQILDGAEARA